jgi:PAS domain S-box-containing protein
MFLSAAAESAEALRARALAEERVRARQVPVDLVSLSPEAVRQLVHELRVHQIELELQNEELQRAQEELEVSRARYFDLYDLAPVGYVSIGEDGLVRAANLTAAGLLDVPRSALLRKGWTQFVHREDQDRYFLHRKQLFLSGAPHGCEVRLLKSNGEALWVRLEARLAQGDDGTRVARTVLSDISERKAADLTLRQSEARHRTLFESSRDALMTLAPPSWQFTSGNAAALALFGARDEADFTAHTPWNYSLERQPDGRLSAEKFPAMLAIALSTGAHSFEWTYQRTADDVFSATVVLTRMDASGEPLMQATVRDETALQKQRALSAQTERLASMGLLAASVGHEINNPLSYVLANAEILARELPKFALLAETCQGLRSAVGDASFDAVVGDAGALLEPGALSQVSECARDVLDGARRIARISKVLSAFSRVGNAELCKVDLENAIECAITMAMNEIRFRATLIKDFSQLPAVWANEGKLSQVFLNLLVNAAHAIGEAPPGDARITIRTWAEGGKAFAEVADTGNGIAEADLPRIFEPFFSTKRMGAGSGLGLSICRNIITEFGGQIRVESKVGQGSRFIVSLPVCAETPEATLASRVMPEALSPASRGRVLIIDDEVLVRAAMKRLLCAHEVVAVSSGKEAQELLEHDRNFDLILCDLMMPGVTGADVHRWLLARDAPLAKRIVFITGGAFGAVAAEAVSESGNLKLQKPFENDALAQVVAERVRVAKSEPPPLSVTPGDEKASR